MQVVVDEAERRRKDWKPGNPVVLADGQEWHFRRPCFVFGLSPDGRGLERHPRCGDARGTREFLDALSAFETSLTWCSAVAGKPEAEREADWAAHPEMHFAAVALRFGRALLLANYDLSDADLVALLRISFDEDDAEGFGVYRVIASTLAAVRLATGAA